MEKSEIEVHIRKMLDESLQLTKPCEQLTLDDDLMNYGMNSFDCVKLIIAIEDFFDIEFNDEDLITDNFASIHNLVAYVYLSINK